VQCSGLLPGQSGGSDARSDDDVRAAEVEADFYVGSATPRLDRLRSYLEVGLVYAESQRHSSVATCHLVSSIWGPRCDLQNDALIFI
jgi:hypothetical protein